MPLDSYFRPSYNAPKKNVVQLYRVGFGVQDYGEQERYEGDFRKSSENGRGMYLTNGGCEYYIGEFQDGQYHGEGQYFYERSEYSGQWANGIRSGFGEMKEADGSKYLGKWEDDTQHGRGKFIDKDGATYDGEVYYADRHGKGCFRSTSTMYEGDWVYSKKHGNGKMETYAADGTTVIASYGGEFADDQKSGFGMEEALDGYYKGNFLNDVRHGKGVLVYKEGTPEHDHGVLELDGLWKKGHPVEGIRKMADGTFDSVGYLNNVMMRRQPYVEEEKKPEASVQDAPKEAEEKPAEEAAEEVAVAEEARAEEDVAEEKPAEE